MVRVMSTLEPAVRPVGRQLMESEANEALLIAGGAVHEGARLLIQGRSHLGGLIAKGDRDYASRVDLQIEDAIRTALRLVAPEIPFLGEERAHGSAALDLAWLAAGRLGASMMLSNCPWDVSAGVLLAREAGGLAYDWDGAEHGVDSRFTIASTPGLKESLLELLPEAR
jgi:myo-inositol-1(or 4)-monophosphatase